MSKLIKGIKLINDGTMISIDPLWITTNDYDYAKKYYFYAELIKHSFDYLNFLQEDVCKIHFNDMNEIIHIEHFDYMIEDSHKYQIIDFTNIKSYLNFLSDLKIYHTPNLYAYYHSNLLDDKTHFGHVGYMKWTDNFISKIKIKIKNTNDLSGKSVYVLSDSTIDHAPDNLTDNSQLNNKFYDIIVESKKKYFIDKLKSTLKVSEVYIDAIGGTGYVNAGNDVNDLIKNIYDFLTIQYQDNYLSNIIDRISNNQMITVDEFDLIYEIFQSYVNYDKYQNLFIYRLKKIFKKYDYFIVLGFGNDIPYLHDINDEYHSFYGILQFMVNLFWFHIKIKN